MTPVPGIITMAKTLLTSQRASKFLHDYLDQCALGLELNQGTIDEVSARRMMLSEHLYEAHSQLAVHRQVLQSARDREQQMLEAYASATPSEVRRHRIHFERRLVEASRYSCTWWSTKVCGLETWLKYNAYQSARALSVRRREYDLFQEACQAFIHVHRSQEGRMVAMISLRKVQEGGPGSVAWPLHLVPNTPRGALDTGHYGLPTSIIPLLGPNQRFFPGEEIPIWTEPATALTHGPPPNYRHEEQPSRDLDPPSERSDGTGDTAEYEALVTRLGGSPIDGPRQEPILAGIVGAGSSSEDVEMHDRPTGPPGGTDPTASRSRSRSRGEEDSMGLSPRAAGCTSPFAHRAFHRTSNRRPPRGFAKRFEQARSTARRVHLRSDWRIWSWCPGDSEEDEASLPLHRFHHPPPAPLRAAKPKPVFEPRVVPILVPERFGRFRVSYNALPGRGAAETPGLPVPLGPPRVLAPPVTQTTSDTRATTSGEDASKGLSTASSGFPTPYAHAAALGARRHGRFFTNSLIMHRQRRRNGHIYVRPFGEEPGGWHAPLMLDEETHRRLETLREDLEATCAARRTQHVAQEFRTAAYTVVTPTLVMSPGPPPTQADLTRLARLVPRQQTARRSRSRSRSARDGTPDRTGHFSRRIVTLVPRRAGTPRSIYHCPDPEDKLEDDLEALLTEDEADLSRNESSTSHREQSRGTPEPPDQRIDPHVVLLTYVRRRGGPAVGSQEHASQEPATEAGHEWEEITHAVRLQGDDHPAIQTIPPRYPWEWGMRPPFH